MTTPASRLQEALPGSDFGPDDKLQHYRNRLCRERSAAAANRAVALLAEMGIKSRIFGSLTRNGEDFPPGSGIDLCVLDENPLNGPGGPRYRDIMLAVSTAGEGLLIQVHFLSQLSPPLARTVQKTGLLQINGDGVARRQG